MKKLFAIVIIIGLLTSGALLLWASSLKAPDLKGFEQRKVEQSTKIYDRTGDVLLYDLRQDIQRTVIPYEEMSRNIKNATVAIEDAEFYRHIGIKPTAIIRAVLVNLTSFGFSQGGSTITQQVVKNSILVSKKKISRKIKEWILALKLERVYSKEKILEFYLNESPYGGNIYGIEEASERFFSKSSRDLTLAESAYLAALPQAPTFFSPYGNNLDRLEVRKNLVLRRMLENKFITEEEHENALQEEVEFAKQQDLGIKAPHFVFYVQQYLESKYGKRALEERGFNVITTIDYELQKIAEDVLYQYAEGNQEKFNASNAALVATDPKTGQILVMVGSRNYFDDKIDGNFNVAIASNRQPGSAFKPFVYAEALNKGYTPETVVFNTKTQFSTECEPDEYETEKEECYTPENYDGIYSGPITFRNALAQSVNIPAIKVLYLAGLRDSLNLSQQMGIRSLTDVNRYGLTLVLGGGEVSLLDITGAYGVFANNGIKNQNVSILKIEDSNGNIIEEFKHNEQRILKEQTALQITDILSDNDARAPAFGEYSQLYFPGRDVAAKTGTTNQYRDAWIVGYTPEIAVGTWAGNNDNSPMEKRVAGFIVAPMWNAFMKEVLLRDNQEKFKKPRPINEAKLKPVMKGVWQGGEEVLIDSLSGKLATEYTPEELRKSVVPSNIHSILYWVNKRDPRGEKPEYPERDSQFNLWEYGVEQWKEDNNINLGDVIIPTEYDDIHLPAYSPNISILSPVAGITYSGNNNIVISIKNASRFPLSKVNYFVNGEFVGSSTKVPFSVSFKSNNVDGIKNNNVLKVVAYDSVLNKGEKEVVFSVSP